MADWTDIPNSALAIGAPPRAADALAFRDNPVALAEGAPGAPRISPWGVIMPVTAGDDIRYTDYQIRNFGVPADEATFAFFGTTMLCSGTVRVRTRFIRPTAGTMKMQLRRWRGTTGANIGSEDQYSSASGDSTSGLFPTLDAHAWQPR